MSVVGYPEEDKWSKKPKFCTRCKRELIERGGFDLYDTYTGEKVGALYLDCPSMIATHDHWRREDYGAWNNYAYNE